MLLNLAETLVAQDNSLFPLTECYLTDIELRQLYRRFGHPLVARLEKVLRQADQE